METESYNNYEQEASRKRPSEDVSNGVETKKSNTGDNLPLLKLLIPNYAAGALIGKGGTNIAELQNKFGGSIRLSANRQCYPGTGERVVVITGDVDQINDINNHIMEKVQVDQYESPEKKPLDQGRAQQVKIVLTNGAAGLLIGRGGLTIKSIQEETKVKISITNREDASVPGERVLTMSGSMDERMEGCRHVIEKIADEPSNVRNSHLKYMNTNMDMGMSHGGSLGSLFNNSQQDSNNLFSSLYNNPMSGQRGANNMGGLSSYGMGGLSNQSGKSKFKTNVQIQVEVPDILVGAILGKQGQTIHEFIQFSGAKVKFSDKNDFVEGTTDRILTITGDMKQAETAYFLIIQKVEQVQGELSNQY